MLHCLHRAKKASAVPLSMAVEYMESYTSVVLNTNTYEQQE